MGFYLFIIIAIYGFVFLAMIADKRRHNQEYQAWHNQNDNKEDSPFAEDNPVEPFGYPKGWRYDRRYSSRPGNFYYDTDWGWFDDHCQHLND